MPLLSRRQLLAAAVAFPALRARGAAISAPDPRQAPDSIAASSESGTFALVRSGREWAAAGVSVRFEGGALLVRSPQTALVNLRLRWRGALTPGLRYLGDQWERSYGDLAWRGLEPERALPWYFLASNGLSTFAAGVKTGAAAFCYWQVDEGGVTLIVDVRNGGRGVVLGARELQAATVVSKAYPHQSAFSAAHAFCGSLCGSPRLPSATVYGGNNWYYAYGKSSDADIRADSERIASWSPTGANRPFMVIDDGWQPHPTAGPWDRGNSAFPDMPGLAAAMRKTGVRPGIWTRPLYTMDAVPDSWKLGSPGAARRNREEHGWTLDPTIPEVAALVQKDARRIRDWGFDLLKHDYSTFDLLGHWGSEMGVWLTEEGWSFADRGRTNAEIVTDFYRSIRGAFGDGLVLGCDTIGHLSAGLFELQRTGDDTSGREWSRTRKMGVNTLAFRAPQHGAFFFVDADCVGLTRQVPWEENQQWLDLLARSGTPLFVSASPDAMGDAQQKAVREAFARAARPQPLGEPLDWMEDTEPSRWKLDGSVFTYRWFAD